MKIDTNLRAAIRAAVKTHNNGVNMSNDHARRVEAASVLANSPKYKDKLKAALAGISRAREEMQKHQKVLSAIGLHYSGSRTWHVDDENKFKRAGGKYPERAKRLDVDRILTDLAQANEVAGKGILRSLNINWD